MPHDEGRHRDLDSRQRHRLRFVPDEAAVFGGGQFAAGVDPWADRAGEFDDSSFVESSRDPKQDAFLIADGCWAAQVSAGEGFDSLDVFERVDDHPELFDVLVGEVSGSEGQVRFLIVFAVERQGVCLARPQLEAAQRQMGLVAVGCVDQFHRRWVDSTGRRNTSTTEVLMGRPAGWMKALTGRSPMKSPGAPSLRREVERTFWCEIAKGLTSEDAAIAIGVSQAAGSRWFRERGGMPLFMVTPVAGRYLSFTEREEIAMLKAQGAGVREIARRLGRAPSTISRELCRNAATRGGKLDYRASVAQPQSTEDCDLKCLQT